MEVGGEVGGEGWRREGRKWSCKEVGRWRWEGRGGGGKVGSGAVRR